MADHILIIDDDAALSQMLEFHFEDLGYATSRAESCAGGLGLLETGEPDVILLDQQLPDGRGVELLDELLRRAPDVPVVMLTGAHDLELAIESIKKGARDFIHKPVKNEELEHAIRKALEHRRLVRRVAALTPAEEPADTPGGELLGRSDAMLQVSKEIALTAPSQANVLLMGESGTGKEVVARSIHQHSGLTGPFVAVNSAAIVETLLESELFGHEKGAFTGAVARKIGKFELARDGTLFLDEIGELPMSVQAKLLRVLQEHSFERVGGTQTLTTNARIIAATNRDLDLEVAEKRFREDLLYRLNVISIALPALRERREDIPLLVEGLLGRIGRNLHKPPLSLSPEAMARLERYNWPGNVRELENVLTQCMVRARDGVLTPEMLPLPEGAAGAQAGLLPPEVAVLASLDEVEAAHVQRVLDHTGGHKGRSCDILHISRPALDRKIQKYGLVLPRD